MGAAASTESDKDELRSAYAAFCAREDAAGLGGSAYSGNGGNGEETFEALLQRTAPNIWKRMAGTGSDAAASAAAAALRDQFVSARRKLDGGDASGGNARETENAANAAAAAAERLRKEHPDWAAGPEANLQRGLVAGTLRSTPLRTVCIALAAGGPAAPDTGAAAGGAALLVPAGVAHGGALEPGSKAVVCGLVSKVEMNGCLVEVLRWVPDKGRHEVRFLDSSTTGADSGGSGKVGLLKPDNLRRRPPSPHSPPSALSRKEARAQLSPEPAAAGPAAAAVFSALVDTGAERSALSPAAAKRLGLWPLLDPSFARTVGGVGRAAGHGRVHFAPLSFPRAAPAEHAPTVAFEAAFDVFEWPVEADFDAILGIDFLVRHGGVVDLPTSRLVLGRPSSGGLPGGREREARAEATRPLLLAVPLEFPKGADEYNAESSNR